MCALGGWVGAYAFVWVWVGACVCMCTCACVRVYVCVCVDCPLTHPLVRLMALFGREEGGWRGVKKLMCASFGSDLIPTLRYKKKENTLACEE